ncbi:MAG TPA: hypothetical protein VK625_10025, partial [Flavitalea sp.]|nr:hypothetical protein [Flavitalea sp.]
PKKLKKFGRILILEYAKPACRQAGNRKGAKKSDVGGKLIYSFLCGFASAEGRFAPSREILNCASRKPDTDSIFNF